MLRRKEWRETRVINPSSYVMEGDKIDLIFVILDIVW